MTWFRRTLLRLLRWIARALPGPLATRLIYLPLFVRHHGRWPKDPGAPGAGFEDLVASRMLHPATGGFGRYADKEKAKVLAKALAPEVMITPTVAVWKLGPGAQAKDLEDFLRPYLGKRFVAKPAHASGKVLLLDRVGPGDVEALFKAADRDYFYRGGEPQYRGLERRVLVERSLALPGKAPPADYRFHCCKGVPWFGAADVGRFVDLREHHFTVPDYRPVFLQAKGKRPSRLPGRPPRFEKMLRVASRLSRPFDYVRVDLYQTKRGVHFGEFTFTPMVGLFKFTDPGFSKWLLERALAPGRAVPLPMEWRGLPSSK